MLSLNAELGRGAHSQLPAAGTSLHSSRTLTGVEKGVSRNKRKRPPPCGSSESDLEDRKVPTVDMWSLYPAPGGSAEALEGEPGDLRVSCSQSLFCTSG